MEGTVENSKELRRRARSLAHQWCAFNLKPDLVDMIEEEALSDSSQDGSAVSYNYEGMQDEEIEQAREQLYQDSHELVLRLMARMEKKGFKVGPLRDVTYQGYEVPRCFTVETPKGLSKDPFLQTEMEMLVAATGVDTCARLTAMYNSDNNDCICEHSAFLHKNENGEYCVKLWCDETIFCLNKIIRYQTKRCDEKRVHGMLLSYLSHRDFDVENVPHPTDRRDYTHFAFIDHCMVVTSFLDTEFKPAVQQLGQCRLDNKRGVVIQLSTSQNWEETGEDDAYVYCVIYSRAGSSDKMLIEDCVDPSAFCRECELFLIHNCPRIPPPL